MSWSKPCCVLDWNFASFPPVQVSSKKSKGVSVAHKYWRGTPSFSKYFPLISHIGLFIFIASRHIFCPANSFCVAVVRSKSQMANTTEETPTMEVPPLPTPFPPRPAGIELEIYLVAISMTILPLIAIALRFYARSLKKTGLSWDDFMILPAMV